MPSWGEILQELQSTSRGSGVPDFDKVRREYLRQLHERTGRSTVLYATDWLSGNSSQAASVTLQDMQGLMEVFHNLPGPNLDLILHSPGGQAEAADRLVRYMRSKFTHVRVFVPLAAMSAATMWAMAADEIVMGKHSQLGPIDPQVMLPSGISMPVGALLEQFEEASQQLAAQPDKIAAWLPTLQQYPSGLLNFCQAAAKLAEQLVAEWVETYMLAGKPDRQLKALQIAAWLADDKTHLSHSRAITRDQLREQGVVVRDLEEDQDLQDAVLSVHHAAMHTFSGSAVKLIENNLGRAFVVQGGQQVMLIPQPVPQQGPIMPQQPMPMPEPPANGSS
jgi:Serine dehydrogenase proteinase